MIKEGKEHEKKRRDQKDKEHFGKGGEEESGSKVVNLGGEKYECSEGKTKRRE